MTAFNPWVFYPASQANSRDERKEDFDKIFAHYDVVSSVAVLQTLFFLSFSISWLKMSSTL